MCFQFCYCITPKVGSTTWIRRLKELTNLPNLTRFEHPKFEHVQKVVVKDIFRLPKSLKTAEKITIVNDFTSSAFVRHPFVRVVSAFIDKIVDENYRNWRNLVNYNKLYKIKVNYCYTQYPIIRNGDQAPPVGFLKKSPI